MARRITTFMALDNVASSFLNDLQDEVTNLIPGNGSNDFDPATQGVDGRVVQFSGATNADSYLLDNSIDWRDRLIWGTFIRLGADNQRFGETNDYEVNDITASPVISRFTGYTGIGAYQTTAAATVVAPGFPPVNGAAGVRSYAIIIDSSLGSPLYVYLYASPTAGDLYLYNNTGGAMSGIIRVYGTADLGLR